jgi:hypothetical protein
MSAEGITIELFDAEGEMVAGHSSPYNLVELAHNEGKCDWNCPFCYDEACDWLERGGWDK